MSFDPDQLCIAWRQHPQFPVMSQSKRGAENIQSDIELTLNVACHSCVTRWDHLGRSCLVIFASCFLPWASLSEQLGGTKKTPPCCEYLGFLFKHGAQGLCMLLALSRSHGVKPCIRALSVQRFFSEPQRLDESESVPKFCSQENLTTIDNLTSHCSMETPANHNCSSSFFLYYKSKFECSY